MRERLKKIRKISIPISIFIFLIALLFGFFSIDQSRQLFSWASTKYSPQQIKVTDINDTSFVVSWITQEKTTATIAYGEKINLGEIKKDTRDKNGNPQNYITHYFLIDNLKPRVKYYFKLISGGKVYDNSGKPYEVSTGQSISIPENDLSQGKILTPQGQPAGNTIVYLSTANSIIQSALTDQQGNWVIPLSLGRTVDLQSYFNYDRSSQVIQIFVQGEKEISNAVITTGNDNPAPDITLGQNYNFLSQLRKTTPTPPVVPIYNDLGSSSTNSSGFFGNQLFSISYPSPNEIISSQTPEFFGSGPKDKNIEITIESENIVNDTTGVDQKGKWTWSPKSPLSLGKHQITVSYINEKGFIEKITREFTVIAAENTNLPSYTASASATPRPTFPPKTTSPTPTIKINTTITPSTKPTSTPVSSTTPSVAKSSVTPTGAPQTISPSPTITPKPTSTPLLLPTPTDKVRTTIPSTESGIPRSGITTPTIILFISGILIVVLGLTLALF